MPFIVEKHLKREIIHYAYEHLCISSTYNQVFVRKDGQETVIRLPEPAWRLIFGFSRLGRRAFRLALSRVAKTASGDPGSTFNFGRTV